MVSRPWKMIWTAILVSGAVFSATTRSSLTTELAAPSATTRTALRAESTGSSATTRSCLTTESSATLKDMLPRIADWKPAEEARAYDPASLFEYIDGAAEAYISYDFKELVVGNYLHGASKATMTVEVYDMGTALDAFGIYSAERAPESRFLAIGVQGYMEEGSLNFLAGQYYVKLLGYEGGDRTEAYLNAYAAAIVSKIKDPAALPVLLKVFPTVGLMANSEKYVARNFMGFKFLNRGYGASYKRDGQEFDAFVIETRSAEAAAAVLKQFIDQFAKSGSVGTRGAGYRIKDAYLKNILVAPAGVFLCGVTKIKDGGEAAGEKVLQAMIQAVSKK